MATGLNHITLNTGNSQHIPSSYVTPETREMLLPLVGRLKWTVPGGMGIDVRTTFGDPGGVVFSFWFKDTPIVLNGVAWVPSAAPWVWDNVERTWLNLGDRYPQLMDFSGRAPFSMPDCPWLTTVILPRIHVCPMELVGDLADIEICIAFTLIGANNS